MTSPPRAGQSRCALCGDVKSSCEGGRRVGQAWVRTRGIRSANRQGEEQHSHTQRESHTRSDEGECSRQGGGGQRGRGGSQDSGNREPESRGWESMCMGGSDNTGDGLASPPRRYPVPGQPLLKRHQVGGVSRSPHGLFAQQQGGPTRGRPAVRGKGTTRAPQPRPHTNTSNPPRGAHVPPARPSVPLHRHFAQQEQWPLRRPSDTTGGVGREIGLPVGHQGP